jgi:hypothetical protein
VDNVVAHVRDKFGNRPGFSIGTMRSDIYRLSCANAIVGDSSLLPAGDHSGA